MSNLKYQISNVKLGQGFTLVELLVVITIMGLLSVVSFAKYTTLKDDQNLKSAANDLQSLIRIAQTNAISRVKCGVSTSAATWLIEFRTDDTKKVDLKCYTTNPAATTLVKTLTFTTNQPLVFSISGQGTCSYPANAIDLNFAPLYGTATFIDKSGTATCFATSTQAIITLKKDSTTKNVVVSKGGTVEIGQ